MNDIEIFLFFMYTKNMSKIYGLWVIEFHLKYLKRKKFQLLNQFT
jgi:hypothetical protein